MARTKTTIHLVGGLELSITDNTSPSDTEFTVIANEIIKSITGGVHMMDNSDVAGTYQDGSGGAKVRRKLIVLAGDYITAAVIEEVD